jgi:hypothetical protein
MVPVHVELYDNWGWCAVNFGLVLPLGFIRFEILIGTFARLMDDGYLNNKEQYKMERVTTSFWTACFRLELPPGSTSSPWMGKLSTGGL